MAGLKSETRQLVEHKAAMFSGVIPSLPAAGLEITNDCLCALTQEAIQGIFEKSPTQPDFTVLLTFLNNKQQDVVLIKVLTFLVHYSGLPWISVAASLKVP